jgi:putative chitinase
MASVLDKVTAAWNILSLSFSINPINKIIQPCPLSQKKEEVVLESTVAVSKYLEKNNYQEVTLEELKAMMPLAKKKDLEKYLPHLNTVMNRYNINTPIRKAHFISQIGHESDNLSRTWEKKNPDTIKMKDGSIIANGDIIDDSNEKYKIQKWNKYGGGEFTVLKSDTVSVTYFFDKYQKNKNLGNINEGDGRAFMGRGLIQVTGRFNYEKYTQYRNKLGDNTDYTSEAGREKLRNNPEIATDSAGWFWTQGSYQGSKTLNLNELADEDKGNQISRKVNGGEIGLKDRRDRVKKAKEVLQVDFKSHLM